MEMVNTFLIVLKMGWKQQNKFKEKYKIEKMIKKIKQNIKNFIEEI